MKKNNELLIHHASWTKLDKRQCILYASIYTILYKMKMIVTEGTLLEKAVWGGEECGGKEGWGVPKGPRKFMGIMGMFIILTVVMASPFYSCGNILFYFKYVQSIVGLLNFNKVFLKGLTSNHSWMISNTLLLNFFLSKNILNWTVADLHVTLISDV